MHQCLPVNSVALLARVLLQKCNTVPKQLRLQDHVIGQVLKLAADKSAGHEAGGQAVSQLGQAPLHRAGCQGHGGTDGGV